MKMRRDEVATLDNDHHDSTLDDEELLARFLGEDYPYHTYIQIDLTSPSLFDISHDSSLSRPTTPNDDKRHYPPISYKNDNNHPNSKNAPNVTSNEQPPEICNNDQQGGKQRKREASDAQQHIMAERNRRKLLAQLFIELSAMLPALKKVDKTSILGEAIKHMHELKEKVNILEESRGEQSVESMVVVKRSKLGFNNAGTKTSQDSDGDDGNTTTLPEIEAKISGKNMLLRVYCENRKGILAKVYEEVEKHHMLVVNSTILSFESTTFDITLLAKRADSPAYNKHVKDLVRSLHLALRSSP